MKFLFVGDRRTGKTYVANLMCRKYNEVAVPTIGMQFHLSPSKNHRIWDLSGDKTSLSLLQSVIKDVDAIVYFCTDEESFQSIKQVWFTKNSKRKYLYTNFMATLEMKMFAIDNDIKLLQATGVDMAAQCLARLEWSHEKTSKPWCCFPFLYAKPKRYDTLLLPS